MPLAHVSYLAGDFSLRRNCLSCSRIGDKCKKVVTYGYGLGPCENCPPANVCGGDREGVLFDSFSKTPISRPPNKPINVTT